MVICGTSRPDPITKRLRSSHGAYRTSQLPMIWRLWPKTEIKSNSKCWQWKFDHKTSELILLIFSWLLWTSLHVLSHKFTSLQAHYLVMNKISTKPWLISITSNFTKQPICYPDLQVTAHIWLAPFYSPVFAVLVHRMGIWSNPQQNRFIQHTSKIYSQ